MTRRDAGSVLGILTMCTLACSSAAGCAGRHSHAIELLAIDLRAAASDVELSPPVIEVPIETPHFTKIRITQHTRAEGVALELVRTLELTRSSHIYVGLAIKNVDATAPLHLDEVHLTPRGTAQTWLLTRLNSDLMIEDPGRPLGGMRSDLRYTRLPAPAPLTEGAPWTNTSALVSGGSFAGGGAAAIPPGFVLLSSHVLSPPRSGPGGAPPDFTHAASALPHYPDWGLLSTGEPRDRARFDNWNVYSAAEQFVPAALYPDPAIAEDALFRVGFHVLARLELDGGWPRWSAWASQNVRYPAGDVFTAHIQALRPLLALWGELALSGTASGPGSREARAVEEHLHATYTFFVEEHQPNFVDRTASGVPYVAYSASRKERTHDDPFGVINTHASAIGWFWSMAELSRASGNDAMQERWRALLDFYRPGSRVLLEKLYPAIHGGAALRGFVGYSATNPGINTAAYNAVTMLGLAADARAAGCPLPLIEAVEHTARFDADPDDGLEQPFAGAPHVARLVRACPLGLSFLPAGAELASITRSISCVSVSEVFQHLRRGSRSAHDPQLLIRDGAGPAASYIATNAAFTSDWTPGFWEQVGAAQVPEELAFEAHVAPAGAGTWTAVHSGDQLRMITDFDGAEVDLLVISSARPSLALYSAEDRGWSSVQEVAATVSEVSRGASPRRWRVQLILDRKQLVAVQLER